jgi:nucleoside-diphosphate-sugar epimerase
MICLIKSSDTEKYKRCEGAMLVLITGGAGRLGITVVKRLLKDGFQVRVFDLDTPRNRKSVLELGGQADIVWGDITSPDSIRRAMEDVDAVVHMAGILPPLADEKPELATRVNVDGTQTVVDLLKEKGDHVPFVFTSSVAVFGPTPAATRPVCVDKDEPCPEGMYAQTKFQAENLIKKSGIDYVVLRLTASMYTAFEISDMKRMYDIPLNNRLEMCHPDDVALAVRNAISDFDTVRGETLVISGGAGQRMLYQDMIRGILGVLKLPVPPEKKFTAQPFPIDWYDTGRSERLLRFQRRGFGDYLDDYSRELSRRFSPLFLPFMRCFVGPLFGKAIVKFM